MNNEYEILEINKKERQFRKIAIAVNSVALSLGIALVGIGAAKKAQDSVTPSTDAYSNYILKDGELYEKTIIYADPIKIVNSDGVVTYAAPANFMIKESGSKMVCYKTEYKKVVAPEGYYLDEKTNKCIKLEKKGIN